MFVEGRDSNGHKKLNVRRFKERIRNYFCALWVHFVPIFFPCTKQTLFSFVPSSSDASRYILPGPGTDCVAYTCILSSLVRLICRLYQLTLSTKAQVVLQLRVFPI